MYFGLMNRSLMRCQHDLLQAVECLHALWTRVALFLHDLAILTLNLTTSMFHWCLLKSSSTLKCFFTFFVGPLSALPCDCEWSYILPCASYADLILSHPSSQLLHHPSLNAHHHLYSHGSCNLILS
jgi:hypothetical protein